MDNKTKSDLIAQLKAEMMGTDVDKEDPNVIYVRERNAVESFNRQRPEDDPEAIKIKEIRKEQEKKDQEEELFRMLRDQRRR